MQSYLEAMDENPFEASSRYVTKGRLKEAIDVLEQHLRDFPVTPFHQVIGSNGFLRLAEELSAYLDAFLRSFANSQEVKAIYLELGEIEINPHNWLCRTYPCDSFLNPNTQPEDRHRETSAVPTVPWPESTPYDAFLEGVRWEFQHPPFRLEVYPNLHKAFQDFETRRLDTHNDSSTISVNDIADLSSLANRLKQQPSAVDRYLCGQLSPATNELLADYGGGNATPGLLLANLLCDLNGIIFGPSIYDAQRFAHVSLRAETQHYLLKCPKGDTLLHLNRLLLEDAYPLELSRKESRSIRAAHAAATVLLTRKFQQLVEEVHSRAKARELMIGMLPIISAAYGDEAFFVSQAHYTNWLNQS